MITTTAWLAWASSDVRRSARPATTVPNNNTCGRRDCAEQQLAPGRSRRDQRGGPAERRRPHERRRSRDGGARRGRNRAARAGPDPLAGDPDADGPDRPRPTDPRLRARSTYRLGRLLRPNPAYRRVAAWLERTPRALRLFTAAERRQGALFGCRMCGQCALPTTGYACPMTCPKQLRNGPCGGVSPDGSCEVYPESAASG